MPNGDAKRFAGFSPFIPGPWVSRRKVCSAHSTRARACRAHHATSVVGGRRLTVVLTDPLRHYIVSYGAGACALCVSSSSSSAAGSFISSASLRMVAPLAYWCLAIVTVAEPLSMGCGREWWFTWANTLIETISDEAHGARVPVVARAGLSLPSAHPGA